MDFIGAFAIPIVLVVVVVALLAWLTRQYHRVAPNEVMVVYGRGETRLITSGGVFVVPILETFKKLDVTIMTIKTEKDEVYTVSGVPIQLDWVAQVQINDPMIRLDLNTPEAYAEALERYGSMMPDSACR